MRAIPVFVFAASLAACGGVEPAANQTNTAQPAEPVAAPEPANAAAPTVEEGVAYPAAFKGRWGLVPGDCIPGASDAKGLMQVEGGTLTFYESRGTAEKLTIENGTKASGELAFTGEGQRWTRAVTLSLEDGGKALVRSEAELPQPLRYAKCEG